MIGQTDTLLNWAYSQGPAWVLVALGLIAFGWAIRAGWSFFKFWIEKFYTEIVVPAKKELSDHLVEASKLANRNSDCIEKMSGTLAESCKVSEKTHQMVSDIHNRTVVQARNSN